MSIRRITTEIMDDVMAKQAAGNPALEASYAAIKANNRRIYPLVAASDFLKERELAKGAGAPAMERMAAYLERKGGLPLAAGGVVAAHGVLTGSTPVTSAASAAGAAGIGLLMTRGAPAALRAAQRAATTHAIKVARGEATPNIAAAARSVAIPLSRIGGREIGRKLSEEDQEE